MSGMRLSATVTEARVQRLQEEAYFRRWADTFRIRMESRRVLKECGWFWWRRYTAYERREKKMETAHGHWFWGGIQWRFNLLRLHARQKKKTQVLTYKAVSYMVQGLVVRSLEKWRVVTGESLDQDVNHMLVLRALLNTAKKKLSGHFQRWRAFRASESKQGMKIRRIVLERVMSLKMFCLSTWRQQSEEQVIAIEQLRRGALMLIQRIVIKSLSKWREVAAQLVVKMDLIRCGLINLIRRRLWLCWNHWRGVLNSKGAADRMRRVAGTRLIGRKIRSYWSQWKEDYTVRVYHTTLVQHGLILRITSKIMNCFEMWRSVAIEGHKRLLRARHGMVSSIDRKFYGTWQTWRARAQTLGHQARLIRNALVRSFRRHVLLACRTWRWVVIEAQADRESMLRGLLRFLINSDNPTLTS